MADKDINIGDVRQDVDYTPKMLVDHLNNKFGCKKSGEKFNHQDIQQYCSKKKLPKAYGGITLEIINVIKYNFKLIRIVKK